MADNNDTGTDLAPQGGREVVAQGPRPNPFNSNPLSQLRNANEGVVAIEASRAIAEAQASMIMAKTHPRDEMRAFEKFMNSCRRPTFAARAFYKFAKGGSNVEGPTIRFAEEAARCWGNIAYGMAELSAKEGVTEMQAFAHDLESNVRSPQNFTVRWIRDRSGPGGAKELTDQRDIYEIAANMGSRRVRARLLAVMPADYIEEGVATCRETLAKADAAVPLPERIKRMVGAFSRIDVTVDMLATRLGHPVDKSTPQELEDLRGLLTAIKEGVTNVRDEFQGPGGSGGAQAGTGAALNAAGAQGATGEPRTARQAAGAGNKPKGAAASPPPASPPPSPPPASPPPPPPPPPAEEPPPANDGEETDQVDQADAPAGGDEDVF